MSEEPKTYPLSDDVRKTINPAQVKLSENLTKYIETGVDETGRYTKKPTLRENIGFVLIYCCFILTFLVGLIGGDTGRKLFAEGLKFIGDKIPGQTGTPAPSTYVPKGYHFVFGDEFIGVGMDSTKWNYRYVNRPYNAGFNAEKSIVQPGDGHLHLVTSYEDGKFLTGMIQSIEQFQYGYFEARIRFQSLQGHHGAFWLQSPLYGKFLDDPGKSGTEIDIVEFFGSGRSESDTQQNLYWNPYASKQKQQRSHDIFYRKNNGVEMSNDFHIFALLWTPDGYIFSIDGIETWHTSDGLSRTPEYIVLSLITSDWENTHLDTSQLPNEMLVDYVRVYRFNEN